MARKAAVYVNSKGEEIRQSKMNVKQAKAIGMRSSFRIGRCSIMITRTDLWILINADSNVSIVTEGADAKWIAYRRRMIDEARAALKTHPLSAELIADMDEELSHYA